MMYNNLLGVTPRPRAKTSGLGVGSASWRIRCTLRARGCLARLPTVAPFRHITRPPAGPGNKNL